MPTSFHSLLIAGLLLAAAPPAWAQTTTVKTKSKSDAANTSVKTKTTAPAATAAPAAAPAPIMDEARQQAKATELTQNLKQALNLTPQQEEKVQQINLRSIREVEKSRQQYRTDLRKLNYMVEEIGQSRLAALKDVLTPAQFARYQQQREKKMGIPNVQGNQGNAVPGMGRGE